MDHEDPFKEHANHSRFQLYAEWIVRLGVIAAFALPIIQKLIAGD